MQAFLFLFAAVFILQSSLSAMPPKVERKAPKPAEEDFFRGSGRGDDPDSAEEDASVAEKERSARGSRLMAKE